MNLRELCKRFSWVPTDEGGHLVTPWRYDDGDRVVVFARRDGSHWHLDDNGEALFRLSVAGIDPESDRVRARLDAFPILLNVSLQDDGESLGGIAEADDLERMALAVAEASSQIQALSALRQPRKSSDFRERVVTIVEAAAREAKIESRRNEPTDDSQTIFADVYLCTPTPLIVIAATSAQRLMEAEIVWLDAARRGSPAYVLATVESAKAIGLSQYTRANYYTDKTVEFAGAQALSHLVTSRLRQTTLQ